jgi:hypothetical protein
VTPHVDAIVRGEHGLAGASRDVLDVSRRGHVRVVVTDRAETLVAGRLGFLEDLTTVTSTATASPR